MTDVITGVNPPKTIRGLKLLRSGKPLTRTEPSDGKKRCSCGYHIRGKEHENGPHHKKGRS